MGDCWTTLLLVALGYLLADITGVLIWALNRHLMFLIVFGVHIYTIMTACSHSVLAAVVTMFTPGLAEVYWLGSEWATRGTFWNPFTYVCAAGFISLGIELVGRRVYADQIAAATRRP